MLRGAPINIEWASGMRAQGREVHASTHLRRRVIILDADLRKRRGELRRIVVHEIFHFVWLRLGNTARGEWDELLAAEKSRGELGWSSEWRKRARPPRGSRRWREYICESFCDTAAWLYAGLTRHEEFTLNARARRRRAAWFARLIEERPQGLRL